VGHVCTSIIYVPFGVCGKKLARPAGLEPTTPSLEGWCSIH
jgi:hypothetical protein